MKPHLKTADGVNDAALDIYDIVEKYFLGRGDSMPHDAEDALYEKIRNYMNELAGYPDYSNYN